MGDPKRRRKKYNSPGHPYQRARLESELIIVGKYGLRNKRELWRARTKLSNYRSQARSLLALEEEEQEKRGALLINKLRRLGIINVETETDDILTLEVEQVLNRRLQTRILEKGFAGTIHQARQLITHRHISINGRVMTSPGYIVPVDEDAKIDFAPSSPFKDPEHPMYVSLTRESTIIEIPEKKPMMGRGGRRR